MLMPFDAERQTHRGNTYVGSQPRPRPTSALPNLGEFPSTYWGAFIQVSHALRPKMGVAPCSASQFWGFSFSRIYAYTIWPITTKFSMVTQTGRGVLGGEPHYCIYCTNVSRRFTNRPHTAHSRGGNISWPPSRSRIFSLISLPHTRTVTHTHTYTHTHTHTHTHKHTLAHVTRDSDTTFKVKRSKVKVTTTHATTTITTTTTNPACPALV